MGIALPIYFWLSDKHDFPYHVVAVFQIAVVASFVALVLPPLVAFMWYETKELLKDL